MNCQRSITDPQVSLWGLGDVALTPMLLVIAWWREIELLGEKGHLTFPLQNIDPSRPSTVEAESDNSVTAMDSPFKS